jgi:hypothetical protein
MARCVLCCGIGRAAERRSHRIESLEQDSLESVGKSRLHSGTLMARTSVTLDSSLVTPLPNARVFFGLPSALEAALVALPESEERAFAALHFAFKVETTLQHLGVVSGRERVAREANLRAALAEFVSIEEAARRDFNGLGKPLPRAMVAIPNPLLHVFRLL